MAEWVVDLASLIVEADSEEEAMKVALDMVGDEQFEVEVVYIERWDT